MRRLIAAGVCVGALVLAQTAGANYYIDKQTAESNATIAAEIVYITVGELGASCRPQYQFGKINKWRDYRWHRWVCEWSGLGPRSGVEGTFRITGHTGNKFGYLVLRGKREI